MTTDSTGAKVSEMRYKPWGEVRYSWTNDTLNANPAYALTKYTFTGQYSHMDDPSTPASEGFGLMHYGARMYDPALGRFTSADTIVPGGVQGYDRYAYVNNSPVRYTDPTGHIGCDEDLNGKCINGGDKPITLDDFQNMSWDERKEWLDDFVANNNLEDWFDDIKGAIDILSSDPDYQDMSGWAAYMDAAVLQAINNGMRINKNQSPVGGGGGAWAAFFAAYYDGWQDSNLDGLIALRLAGEQGGVNYGVSLSETTARFNNSNPRVQLKIGLFLAGANGYRSTGIWCRNNGTCSNNIFSVYADPRTAVETAFFQYLGQAPDFVSWGIWGTQIHPYGYQGR
ncbi:MAG: RHS repeat-associated core domain-containing protein [Chloroflexi bacterium]|nr:RHS repeat-associated core domain-containing protein [Chloroflexota bacterium]